MPEHVFISYASHDEAEARAVCVVLERAQMRCWMAPRDIPAGTEWSSAIATALGGSKAVVLLYSEASNASPQVLREVDLAVRRQIPVVPYRITNAAPSAAMDYLLSVSQWLDAFALDPDEAHRRLVAALTIPAAASRRYEPVGQTRVEMPADSLLSLPATARQRFVAFVVDTAIVAVPTLIFLAAFYDTVLNGYTNLLARVATGFRSNWLVELYGPLMVLRDVLFVGTMALLATVPLALYSAICRFGERTSTIGEAAANVRVVSTNGRTIGPGHAFFRTMSMVGSVAPLGVGLVGVWRHRQRRALHDRIAGTNVVTTRLPRSTA